MRRLCSALFLRFTALDTNSFKNGSANRCVRKLIRAWGTSASLKSKLNTAVSFVCVSFKGLKVPPDKFKAIVKNRRTRRANVNAYAKTWIWRWISSHTDSAKALWWFRHNHIWIRWFINWKQHNGFEFLVEIDKGFECFLGHSLTGIGDYHHGTLMQFIRALCINNLETNQATPPIISKQGWDKEKTNSWSNQNSYNVSTRKWPRQRQFGVNDFLKQRDLFEFFDVDSD